MKLRAALAGLLVIAALSTAGAQTLPGPPLVGVALNSSASYMTPVAVNISNSGNNTVIGSATGKVIRVYRIVLVAASTVAVTVQDGSSTALTGAMTLSAGVPLTLDFSSQPWFVTSSGNAFILNLGSSVQVSGAAYYQQT
jgi:hypothetical protein